MAAVGLQFHCLFGLCVHVLGKCSCFCREDILKIVLTQEVRADQVITSVLDLACAYQLLPSGRRRRIISHIRVQDRAQISKGVRFGEVYLPDE